VPGKLIYLRISHVLLLTMGLWLLPAAYATPIHPTAQQILKDAQKPDPEYIPARAGWNGPETQTTASVNPLLERFRPAAQMAANRDALLALATPDLKIWTLLAMMILGIRLLLVRDNRQQLKPVLVEQPRTEQPPSHLKAA
jgi:hypothetical protein